MAKNLVIVESPAMTNELETITTIEGLSRF